jgi:hypothetical protein
MCETRAGNPEFAATEKEVKLKLILKAFKYPLYSVMLVICPPLISAA